MAFAKMLTHLARRVSLDRLAPIRKRHRDSAFASPEDPPPQHSCRVIDLGAEGGPAGSALANHAQCLEIMRYRSRIMRRSGRMVTLDEAAREWIEKYAARWRSEFEHRRSQTSAFHRNMPESH